MTKTWFHCLLAIMIVFQSFLAVASAQDLHQVDLEHIQVEHSHESDSLQTWNTGQLDSQDQHNPADCHHCGHCHGSHSQWVASEVLSLDPTVAVDQRISYLALLNDGLLDNPLRPPIF